MCFQVLSLLIACLALGKAAAALLWPARFYAFRSRQYAAATVPASVAALLALVAAMTLLAWACFIRDGTVRGLVVTLLLTLGLLAGSLNVMDWPRHAERMRNAMPAAHARAWEADIAIGALGLVFLALGLT